MIGEALDVYVFSGTGNTLLVAEAMCAVFRQAGVDVRLRRMERHRGQDVDVGRSLGLAFPVAAQATYPLVWEFARSLPEARGIPAFMVDTMMAYSGGVVGPLRSVVAGKGYRPVGAREIRMPLNCLRRHVDPARDAAVVARGLREARSYAQELLRGATTWGRVPILPDLMRLLACGPLTWRLASALGRRMEVDKARCLRCKQCVELCPVGNITFDQYSVFGARCLNCMRCVSFCPAGALSLPLLGGTARYRAVSVDAIMGRASTSAPDPGAAASAKE